MKTCPYCAEQIQDAAIICRFCGRDTRVPVPAPQQSHHSPDPTQPQSNRDSPPVSNLSSPARNAKKSRAPHAFTWLEVAAISLGISTLAFGGRLLSPTASVEDSGRWITSIFLYTWLISIGIVIRRKAKKIEHKSTKGLTRVAWLIPLIGAIAFVALVILGPAASGLLRTNTLKLGERVTLQVEIPTRPKFQDGWAYFETRTDKGPVNILYIHDRLPDGSCAVLSGTLVDYWPDMRGLELVVDSYSERCQ